MSKACLIVHPGYSINMNLSKSEELGSYQKYWNNMNHLSKKPIDNLILVLEENKNNCLDFKPNEIWNTEKNSGIFIKDYLNNAKKQGIDEFLIAGEWVYWCGEACLGSIAREIINKGLKAKIINSCVYPLLKPDEDDYFNNYSFRNGEIWGYFYRSSFNFINKLYDNSVKI